MKEPHIKGIAIHDDPESCVGDRKVAGEALTGARMGTVLSREIRQTRAPTLLSEAEGHMPAVAKARQQTALRGRRPVARTEPSCARTGSSLACPRPMAARAASERPEVTSR